MNVIVWGSTGQSEAIIPILEFQGYYVSAIFDDIKTKKKHFDNIPLFSGKDLDWWIEKTTVDAVVIAIGNPHAQRRLELMRKMQNKYQLELINIIHKEALISNQTILLNKSGLQIAARANVREFAKVESGCILNCNCLVEHDCYLAPGVEIGPGAIVCGEVSIGRYSWIGANATILPKLEIGENCIIGAGSVVTKNIPDNYVVIGNNARFLKFNEPK